MKLWGLDKRYLEIVPSEGTKGETELAMYVFAAPNGPYIKTRVWSYMEVATALGVE